MTLDDEQVKKLEEFARQTDQIIGYLINQIKTKQITGQVYKNQIAAFIESYDAFRDSVR